MNELPERCAGCVRADEGVDRIEQKHSRECALYDAFFDASDAELSALIRGER